MNQLSKAIKNPYKIVGWMISNIPILRNNFPDETYLKIKYRSAFGEKLDLKNPETFNEKLQWLKLYDRKPIYSTMVDKYEVKKYVASIIGEEYIIPTLGVWNRFEDINFDDLPNQFVLKCTHDSGGVVICKDKSILDIDAARKKINKSLRTNYYLRSKEWPYKNVRPRIIAEQYMEDTLEQELSDYKIHSFNGVPKVILVCKDRFSDLGLTEDFFDQNWTHLEVCRKKHPNSSEEIKRPKELDKMLGLAETLSRDVPFLRSDFYTIDDKVYFGELTFFPASGFEGFKPEKFDKELGDWLVLPVRGGGYC